MLLRENNLLQEMKSKQTKLKKKKNSAVELCGVLLI